MSQRQIRINPRFKPATWEDIKAKRNELEQSPIRVENDLLDADRDSIMRMENAIKHWNQLPTVSHNSINWKTADNRLTSMYKSGLEFALEAISIRAAKLFERAEIINGGNYLVEDLDRLELWEID